MLQRKIKYVTMTELKAFDDETVKIVLGPATLSEPDVVRRIFTA